MNTCAKCKKVYCYNLEKSICPTCKMKETIQDRKCESCGQTIISDNSSDTQCKACLRKKSHTTKKIIEAAVGVIALIGTGIYAYFKSNDS